MLKRITNYISVTYTAPHAIRKFLRYLRPYKTEHPLIRLGSENDGGYLVPDDLSGITACYSPGVSDNCSFELEFCERGIPCFLADYSVDHAPSKHPNLYFEKVFIGNRNTDCFITLPEWMRRNESKHETGDLILQMDIEGAEWEVLNSIDARTLTRFRIIILELHGIPGLMSLKSEYLDKKRVKCAKKLSKYYDVVHLHPNNSSKVENFGTYSLPDFMEVTLLRKDRIRNRTEESRFPHPLDAPCVPSLPDQKLPECWYQ